MSDSVEDFDSVPYAPPAKKASALEDFDAVKREEKSKPSEKYNPVEGMSDFQRLAAGAGKSVADLYRSVNHLTGISRLWGGEPTTQADIDESSRLDAPLMATPAGIAGNIGGTVASMVIPLTGAAKVAQLARLPGAATLGALANPSTYGAAAAAGAVQGGLLTPARTEDSSKTNLLGPEIAIPGRVVNAAKGAVGGLLGNAAVNAIGRVAHPVGNALSSAGQRGVDILESAGVPLDAAQRTGSAFLGRMKASLSDNPFTAARQAEAAGVQKAAYNRAVLKTIGEDAEAATPDVMGAAKKRIGQVFEDVAERNPVHFDNHLQGALAGIENEARGTLNDQQFGVIKRQLENILTRASEGEGKIDGKATQTIKTQLDRLSMGQDQSVGHAARDIREVMDDAMQRSTALNGNKGDYAALQEARKQWGNMRKIESAIDKEGRGDISPARLANVLGQKRNRNASVYGEGSTELSDLAHAGNMILPEKLPNSGTTARQLATSLGLPGVLGGAEYLRTGDPKDAVIAAGAGFAGPRLGQMALNNPAVARYLANGMEGRAKTLGELLSSPQTNVTLGQLRRIPASMILRQQELAQ